MGLLRAQGDRREGEGRTREGQKEGNAKRRKWVKSKDERRGR